MYRRSVPRLTRLAALGGVLVAQACGPMGGGGSGGTIHGAEARLGAGVFSSYAELDRDGAPRAIGLTFPAQALSTLPTSRSDGHHCFDLNGDGAIQPDPECIAAHERVIPLPSEVARRADIPFKWILLNWNPEGHVPAEVYGLPHFDIHYVIEPIENVFAIQSGPCGDEHMRCDQFERAMIPVPEGHMHPDFQNVGAAVPAMGNHLVDLSAHEFHGAPFDRTWIYGTYDGRVTFWEEMVTRDFLLTRPVTCFDLKTPAAVAVTGYYPTRSCFGVVESTGEQRVSIEGFVHREASMPAVTGS